MRASLTLALLLVSLRAAAQADGMDAGTVEAHAPATVATPIGAPPDEPLEGGQGFELKLGRHWKVAPILMTDFDFRAYPSDDEGYTGFALARARFGARVSAFDRVDAVFAGAWENSEGPRVYDAFLAAHLPDGFLIELGYARSVLFPSGRDELEAWLPLQERSLTVDALWPGRELGALVAWSSPKVPLEAWLRISNGTNNFVGNDNSVPAVEARVDLVAGRQHHDANATLGLRFGVAAHWDPNSFDRLGVSGTAVGGFVFWRAPIVSGRRWVTDAHLIGDLGPLELRVEGGFAIEGRSRDTDGNPATPREITASSRSGGLSAELVWRVSGAHRVPGVWPGGRVQFDWDSWKKGSMEVALRGERLWLGQGAADLQPGGATSIGAAIRWWSCWGIGASIGAYGYAFDSAPLEIPDRTTSWTLLARVSVGIR